MQKHTLDLLDTALDAVREDVVPGVEELARKSADGTLSAEDQAEYSELVRLNDTLSLLKLQAEELLAVRVAS
jgi:hypothetical protein